VFWIGYAAIYRTNSGTLGFFMKTGAFGAFVWNNIIYFAAHWGEFFIYIYGFATGHFKSAQNAGSLRNGPFHSCFVNGIIGTFGLTGSAVNTFFGDNNCHE
jgi:hypothetical protein